MSRFNTGNPIGSISEEDAYDNMACLDQAMNSTDPTWRDRFNVEKPTIDAALKSAGFMPAGFDFVTGGTLQPGDRNKAVYNPAPNGDNNWYRWNGVFPKEIAANSQPNPKDENNWVPVLIKTSSVEREALRRTYLEAGYNLVEGSFEQGGVLTSPTDVLLDEVTGKAYSYTGTLPHTVATGSSPSVEPGMWTDRSPAYPREKSVLDYGANTNSVDNTSAFNAAKQDLAIIPVPDGVFSIGNTTPDLPLSGSGVVVANGVQISAGGAGYNPEQEIFSHTPNDYQREKLGITYPPPPFATLPGTQKRYRTVFSLGSQLGDPDKLAGYVTAFGNFNGANMNQWFAVDAFGGDTLMYAYNVERTVAVGSESLAWFGAPNSTYLQTFKHDWWRRPRSNPYLPGDPLWNPNGLADVFPGLSAEIGNYAGYATSTAEAGYTATLGRNAGNHTIKGTDNVFIGFASGQDLYAGDQNTAVGSLSLQGAVFANRITAIGREAGRYCKDSEGAVFVGHGSGRTVQNATNSVFVGVRAGDGVVDGVDAVVIGAEAGKGHATLNNVLTISNASLARRKPLIGGKFDVNYAGVNADPALMRAKWHVRNADSGSTLIPAVGILVEGINQGATTIETSNTGFGSYRFADPESIYVGGMDYAHSSDRLSFLANGARRWSIESGGHFCPFVDNAYSVGTSSLRASVIYAGTGTINTSDAREKTAPLPIDDAVLDAWGDVQLITFQWLESIRQKGDDARWHYGVIAQQVRDAFAAHGLDGTRYGLLCYDEWGDKFEPIMAEREATDIQLVENTETGEMEEVPYKYTETYDTGEVKQTQIAGNRWGIRPDQCLFVEAAYQRRERSRDREKFELFKLNVESRLSELEKN